jgi:4-amino-4-deoxy-L-arabinose transferase-like glycosyltransferase
MKLSLKRAMPARVMWGIAKNICLLYIPYKMQTAANKRLPAWVIIFALLAFTASLILSNALFSKTPFINDEFGYLFQAKLFASGHLYAPSPDLKEAFDFPHIINNGKWYSQYPPGLPILLVPFMFINAPWLLNPLLAALSVIIFYLLGLELFGKREALLSAILGSLSMWFLTMSATYMSHTSNMLSFSLFLLFFFRSLKTQNFRNGILGGLSLGMAFLIRPYETVWACIPFVIYYGLKLISSRGKLFKNALAFSLSAIFVISIIFIYNYITNGNPLLMGYVVRYGPEHSIGFGKTGYTQTPHTPFHGAVQVGQSLKAINKYLFGWPLSSLFPLFFFFLPGTKKKGKNTEAILLALTIISLTFGLFIYWGTFILVGARFFFTILPALILLCSRGLIIGFDLLPEKLSTNQVTRHGLNKKLIAALFMVVLFAYSYFYTFPRETGPNRTGALIPANLRAKDYHAFCKTFELLSLPHSIILIEPLHTPLKEFPSSGWEPGFLLNDPFLKKPKIFCRLNGYSYSYFFEHFPERKLYLYWGTYKRGYLVEIKRDGQNIFYEKPTEYTAKNDASSTRLVSSPEEVFYPYSDDFRIFLKELFANTPFEQVNSAWLQDRASYWYQKRDIQRAAFSLEAALQLETDLDTRYRLLIQLAGLYRRINLPNFSDIILNKINSDHIAELYDVIPERGF